MDLKTLFEISYGLYLVTANDNGRDNGCIINTFSQQTDTPLRLSITINKQNLTAEMIDKSGEFTISILSEKATFEMFKRFGMQSGREINKFEGIETVRTYIRRIYDKLHVRTRTEAVIKHLKGI